MQDATRTLPKRNIAITAMALLTALMILYIVTACIRALRPRNDHRSRPAAISEPDTLGRRDTNNRNGNKRVTN